MPETIKNHTYMFSEKLCFGPFELLKIKFDTTSPLPFGSDPLQARVTPNSENDII